jgi:hypothetical protein
MAKQRWLNREILEVVSTEFRDRSVEYYVRHMLIVTRASRQNSSQRYALESGVTTINGKVARPVGFGCAGGSNRPRVEYLILVC